MCLHTRYESSLLASRQTHLEVLKTLLGKDCSEKFIEFPKGIGIVKYY